MQSQFQIKKESSKIILLSLIFLLLGFGMLNGYIPSRLINILFLIFVSYLIYFFTLQKKKYFRFLMIMYICLHLPYAPSLGGAYLWVGFVSTMMYFSNNNLKRPFEKNNNSRFIAFSVFLIVLSNILGWIFKFTGNSLELSYSILSFGGMISMFFFAKNTDFTEDKIKVFFYISFFLIIYSSLVSINKFIGLIPRTAITPIYAMEYACTYQTHEAGGLIGPSPLYGEWSMFHLIFFLTISISNKTMKCLNINKVYVYIGILLAITNIFMSISRAIFFLSIFSIFLLVIFQNRLNSQKINVKLFTIIIIMLIGAFVIGLYFNLFYVFERIEKIDFDNVSLQGVISGKDINREQAMYYNIINLKRESWLLGYGWGILKNNMAAWFGDVNFFRGSPHNQYFAVLFLFGWIGTIAYFLIILYIIIKSIKTLYFTIFSPSYLSVIIVVMLIFNILFLLNCYKADAISRPNYFTLEMIWAGLAISAISKVKEINKRKFYEKK